VRQFRERDATTPVVLMGYMNPVEIHGAKAFAGEAVDAGVDGVLLVDCPIEQIDAAQPLRAAGLQQIFLAAPTTTDTRLKAICDAAQGFLYYVSFAGITGADLISMGSVRERVTMIRQLAHTPVAVGFGVRDAASAVSIGEFADAVVIGSALVDRLAGAGSADELCMRAKQFLAPIRAALDVSAGHAG
jgi:tryptophan synthase alpha chain